MDSEYLYALQGTWSTWNLPCMLAERTLYHNYSKSLMQGYADDIAIEVMGKHLNSIAELTQKGFRKMNTWCKAKGLSVNLEKTEVVLFIRKRKTRAACIMDHKSNENNTY